LNAEAGNMNDARRTFTGLVRKSLGLPEEKSACCAERVPDRASPGKADQDGAGCCGKPDAADAAAPPARTPNA
jgi:hypothetical protein